MSGDIWRGIVRTADASEEDDIMALCRELHAENGFVGVDEAKVRDMLRRAFDRQGGIIGVIGKPGAIEAVIYLLLTTLWFAKADEAHLEELFAYVRPDYRKSRHAEALVSFAKQASEALKIPLFIGMVTNKRTAGKVRLYRRVLGYPAGTFFVINGRWQNAGEPAGPDVWSDLFGGRRERRKVA